MRRIALISSIIALLPAIAGANAWEYVGFSGRTMSMGGAAIGGAQGAAATRFNPAGLIRNKVRGGELSFITGHSLLQLDVEENEGLSDVQGLAQLDSSRCNGIDPAEQKQVTECMRDVAKYNRYINAAKGHQDANEILIERARRPRPLYGVTLGGSLPLAYDPEDAWLAVGGAVFVPLGPVVYQRLKSPDVPFFFRYDDGPHRVVINLGGAAELPGNIRLGVGLDVLVDVVVSPEVGLFVPPEVSLLKNGVEVDPNLQDFRFYVDGTIKLPVAVSPVAGIQWEPTDWLSMGVMYRHQQQVDIDLSGELVVYSGQAAASKVPLDIATSGVFTPTSIGGGVSVRPIEELVLNVDATYKRWSNYKPPFSISYQVSNIDETICNVVQNLEVSTIEDVLDDILPPDSSNTVIQEARKLLLSEQGELDLCKLTSDVVPNTVDGETYTSEAEFKNVVEIAVGAEYVLDETYAFRAGYRYQPTPIPEQTGVYNILDADTHVISGGIGLNFGGLNIGLNSQYRLLKSNTVKKLTIGQDDGKDDLSGSDSDALPDTTLNTAELADVQQEFVDAVEGRQYSNPLFPSYTIGGGYLSMGLEVGMQF